jgi:hypothetical protein
MRLYPLDFHESNYTGEPIGYASPKDVTLEEREH